LPVCTQIKGVVIKDVRLSSKILPVMSIVALSFVMFLVEWAPLSLEIEHVEVCVFKHEVDYSGFYIFKRVSEWTEVTILTGCYMLRKFGAKFGFIFFNVVESFNSVMSQWALILYRTFISFWKFAQFWRKLFIFSSSIFYGMIESTMLVVVLVRYLALICFELS
jgi:hypothetical protein